MKKGVFQFNTQLKEKLLLYKQLTQKLINCIEKEQLENVDAYVEERQKVISSIDEFKYTQNEFKDICKEIDLVKYEETLTKLAWHKKDEAKREMNKMKVKNSANKNYNKNSIVNRNFFSTKI